MVCLPPVLVLIVTLPRATPAVGPKRVSFLTGKAVRLHEILEELELRSAHIGALEQRRFPPTDPSPLSRTLVSLFNLSRTWPRV